MGVVSPAGNNVTDFWTVMLAGRSTAAPIQTFDTSNLTVRFACTVAEGFDEKQRLSSKELRRADRFVQFALVSALMALDDAGNPEVDVSRAAVVAGSGLGGAQTNLNEAGHYFASGRAAVHPLTVPMSMPNAAAANIALKLGWEGPNFCVATACATGAHAVGEGLRLLRDGSADIVLAGASEASLTPFSLTAFGNLQALSTRNDAPDRASRPFDVDRDGFVMSEGAAFFVLERLADAKARRAPIYAAVAGYGRNSDAHHVVMPDPGGAGAAKCMQL